MIAASPRLPHIVLLQAFGVILVIIGHILAPYATRWYGYEINNPSCNFIHHIIYTFHMPLFFFISGYLYEYKNHEEKTLLQETRLRFKRLILPFLLIGVLIFVPTVVFISPHKLSINNLNSEYIMFLTLKHTGHLWFLPTLFAVLIVYSMLLKTPLKKHLIILAFVILIIRLYTPQLPLPWAIYRAQFGNIVFVYMGYIFAKTMSYDSSSVLSYPKIKGGTFSKLYLMLIILFILRRLAIDFVLNVKFILDPMAKISLLYTVALIISITQPKLAKSRIINQISKNMMGIYLLQEPLIIIGHRVISENIGQNPIYSILILTPIVLIMALGLTILYKRVRNKKKAAD